MGGITLEEMSDEYFDVLKELGNIGAGNATTALSQMMQCKVDMSVPQVKLMEFKELGQLMGGEERAAAHFMKVNGCTYAEYRKALGEANAAHRRRNGVAEWKLDLSYLSKFI